MSRTSAIEAALEVARRPTTRPGERDAAIAGALRLISAAGLDPDDFDIPGRKRTKRRAFKVPDPSAFRDSLFDRPRSPFFRPRMQMSEEELREALRELSRQTEASLRRAAEQMNDPAYKREVEDFLRQYEDKRK